MSKVGSGKSVKAREKAMEKVNEGKKVLFLDGLIGSYTEEDIPNNKNLEYILNPQNDNLIVPKQDLVETLFRLHRKVDLIVIDHHSCHEGLKFLVECSKSIIGINNMEIISQN